MRGVRPSLRQKKILKDQGYDPNMYLLTTITPEELIFIHKESGQVLRIRY